MHGLLLIDKPAGLTSHDVVDAVRRIAKTRHVGHAGTLDPFATGLLILGIGQGTKQLTGLVGLGKEYEAELTLGATSTTFDVEGKISPFGRGTIHRAPTANDINDALDQFRGGYEQKAPLHSAKKIGGKKLYELARAGRATEEMRPTKHVSIYKLLATGYSFPVLKLHVACSSGTYIRSLADDIGRTLGTGAYLTALRRTKIGPFDVKDALPLDRLTEENIKMRLFSTLDKSRANW